MLISRALQFVAPANCLSCQLPGDLLCRSCLTSAPIQRTGTCFRCNKLSPSGRTCPTCRTHSRLFGVTVASYYDGVIKELILALKFGQAQSAAELGAQMLIPKLNAANYDLVTSVPSAPRRYRRRGYNQSALLAKTLGRQLGLPYTELLGRTVEHDQIGANRQERLDQIQGAFYAKRAASGQRILIVDDVLTTGATLSECALILKTAGARRVSGAVLAKH